jgi:hypothetical protein
MENIVQGQWFGTSGADLGTPIDGSLRFNPDNNTRITRTLASGRSQNTSTVAFWFKNINSDWGDYSTPTPFLAYTDSNNYVQFQFDRDTRGMVLRVNAVVGGSNVIDKRTDGNFSDPSAWYHLCVVFDTSNATAEDRTRIYVNGIRCTNFDTNTNCAQSQGISVNAGVEHAFGGNTGFSHSGGFLADVYFLDGIAVSHDSDGVLDEFIRINDQGICVPKAYSGNYNTNGFHLDFNSTTLDTSNTRFTDQSGEDNHFTYANFDTTTTSSAYLLSNDSPTDNYAVMVHNSGHSGADGDPDMNLGGTQVNNWNSTHKSIHSTFALKEGKWYWELYRANSNHFYAGIADVDTQYYKDWSGGSHWSFSVNTSGDLSHMGSENLGDAGAIGLQSTFGNTIDFDADEWKGYADGSAMFSGNNMLGASQHIDRNDTENTNNPRRISPSWGHASHAEVEFHTGAHAGFTNGFRQTMPTGFKKLRTSDLPDLAVTRPQDHFRVVNYGGNNTDRTIDFGFRPDFVCIFQTLGSSSVDNRIFDSCNGLTTGYYSMSSGANRTTSSDYITAVSDTGVTIKSGASNEGINEDSHRYSAWGFKMGGAPTATNTATSGAMTANSVSIDGELQSSYTPSGSPTIYPKKMSINTEAKMSLVLYDGNNTDGATVPHGLGTPPASIWVKRITATDDWRVYHHCEEAGAPKYIRFNANATSIESDDSWNSTPPNSNTFSLGQVSNVNSGSTYIAICFAEVPGFSAFGMNKSNQDGQGPYCVTMFEPALVFGKDAARGDHWWCFDNALEPRNDMDFGYRVNLTGANNLNFGELAFFANGFRHRAASGEHNYGSGANIWFAFAHRPFGGENSAPNTAHFDSNLPSA